MHHKKPRWLLWQRLILSGRLLQWLIHLEKKQTGVLLQSPADIVDELKKIQIVIFIASYF